MGNNIGNSGRVRGGVKGTTPDKEVTSTNQSANRQAVDVQVRTSAGVAVDAFGGGAQFAEDSAFVNGSLATLSGVVQQTADAALSSDGDVSLLQVDSNGFLKVNIKAGSSANQQYADGAARGTATGTLAMVDDGVNIQSLSGDANGRLNVAEIVGPVALPTGASTEATLAAASAKLPATLGQKVMAASLAVVVASDQSAIPISAVSLPLPTGASTAALQTQPGVDIGDVTVNNAAGAAAVNVQDGGNSLTVDSAQLPAALVGGRLDIVVGAALPAGTANIGDVDVLSVPAPLSTTGGGTEATALRVTIANDSTGLVSVDDNGGSLTVDVGTALPAGTNRIGGTYPVGGQLIDEVPTVRTVNRAFVNATATGNTEVVAAQGGGIRIRVLAVIVSASAIRTVKFQSATTDISMQFALANNGGFVMPETEHGWFQTAANEALNFNVSGATASGMGVQVIWVQAT